MNNQKRLTREQEIRQCILRSENTITNCSKCNSQDIWKCCHVKRETLLKDLSEKIDKPFKAWMKKNHLISVKRKRDGEFYLENVEEKGAKLSNREINIWKSCFPPRETEIDPILWKKTALCNSNDTHLHMINYCYQVKKQKI